MDVQVFDYSVNLLQSLIWQYNEAVNLQSLVESKQAWYDDNQTQFWTDWYNDVFNLITANEVGLAVWSKILGLPLFIPVNPDPPGTINWGFGVNRANFNHGNFTHSNTVQGLTIEQRRLVLRMRYFQLVSRGASPQTNFMLQLLFGQSQMWVQDRLNMSILYQINFAISPVLLTVFQDYDLLPRPAGVKIQAVNLTQKVWGFGANRANFGNGNFVHYYYPV